MRAPFTYPPEAFAEQFFALKSSPSGFTADSLGRRHVTRKKPRAFCNSRLKIPGILCDLFCTLASGMPVVFFFLLNVIRTQRHRQVDDFGLFRRASTARLDDLRAICAKQSRARCRCRHTRIDHPPRLAFKILSGENFHFLDILLVAASRPFSDLLATIDH